MTQLSVVVCLAFDHRAPPDGLARFKECILHCPFVESALEVAGTFDLIVRGSCGSLAEYGENMERIRPQLARYVSRIDTCFVSKTLDLRPSSEEDDILWLPCEGGRKGVPVRQVDKIVAEGDYMRVHVGQWNCLVHLTMQRLCERLCNCGFIKLHRSSLVRIGFIDRLIHDDHRWLARLRDGTQVSVAKSHVQEVLQLISGESSKPRGDSPNPEQHVEQPGQITEKSMTLTI